MTDLSDDAKRNREGWTKANFDYTDAPALLRGSIQVACNSSLSILRNAAAVSGFSSATFPFVLEAASRRTALIIV